jgi:hypothetical protein
MPTDPRAKTAPVVVEPRYAKLMPWVLLVMGIAAAVAAFVLRSDAHDSVVVVQSRLPPTATDTASTSGAKATRLSTTASSTTRTGRSASGAITRKTVTRKTISRRPAASSTQPTPSTTGTTAPPAAGTSTASTPTSTSTTSPSAFALADDLPAERKTTTDKRLSDSIFTAMLGIAAVLLVLGTFYSRISKITIGGNTVDLTVPAAVASQDAKAISDKVAERTSEEMRSAADEEGKIDPEQASRIAAKGATAATSAQLQAARLRLAATAAAPAPPAVSVNADELRALGSGMPLSPDLLTRLTEQALTDPTSEQ